MKKIALLFSFFILLFANSIYSQSDKVKERIGVIFRINGPFEIHSNTIFGTASAKDSISKESKYYDAIMFLKSEKANPTSIIKEFYINSIRLEGYDLVVIDEELNEKNFPFFESKKNKYFDLNIKVLKEKYNVDKVLIVFGGFGFEIENFGDKRTNIALNNFIVNTNTNIIEKRFYIGNIKNIKKDNLLNPPDYPNIVESMNRLLDERIFPEVKSMIEKL